MPEQHCQCVSEPQSRSMGRRGGRARQGYNAQAVIDAGESGLIVGAHLSDAPNDSNELGPALEALAAEAGRANAVLVDQGYDNTEQIAQIEREHSVLILCPPQCRFNAKAYNPERKGRRAWKWQRRRLPRTGADDRPHLVDGHAHLGQGFRGRETFGADR